MFNFITILIVLVSIALVLVVLVQKSKGGGLASGFASTNNIMGVHKTTDFLEKATWWLIGVVAVLCIVSTAFLDSGNQSASDRLERGIQEQAARSQTPETALPNLGGTNNAPTLPGVSNPVEQSTQQEGSASPAQETPAN